MTDKKAKSDKTQVLASDPIGRLVLRFLGTTMIALMLSSIYSLLDMLFVSWGIGDNAAGSVSIVFPFVVLQGAVSTAVGSGAASIVSRKLGEGKRGEAGEVTLNALIVFYAPAITVTIVGLLLTTPFLSLMGVTEDLLGYSKQYFTIILIGNVFSTGFSSIIRAEGKMLYGLLIWVIPISINIALDVVFIFVLKWGVAGTALSTVICQFMSFCMSILFFVKFTVQNFKGAKIKIKRIGEILAIGLPSLVQIGSMSILSLLLNNVLGNIVGTVGVNAFAYISKIIVFGTMPFTALTQALSPIVGYNYGEKNMKRIKKAISFSLIIGLTYAMVAVLISQSIPQYLMRVFTNDNQIISLGVTGILIISLALPFMLLPMLAGAAFQAIGNKTWAFIMYSANIVFMIPCTLIFTRSGNISAVWWAYVAANFMSAVLVFIKVIELAKK